MPIFIYFSIRINVYRYNNRHECYPSSMESERIIASFHILIKI
jgi:hypothetical protein